MAYFDECVSFSTFYSSDFSSPEDPPLNIVGGTTPVGNGVFSLQASSGASAADSSSSCFKDKQELGTREQFTNCDYGADLMASSSRNELPQDQSPSSVNAAAQDLKSHFSFACRPPETPELQHDIKKYIRNSEKDIKKVETTCRLLDQIITPRTRKSTAFRLLRRALCLIELS